MDYTAETYEDLWTGRLLLKVYAPREKGETTRMLDFAVGKFAPYSEGECIPYIALPTEGEEKVLDELLRVLGERKNLLEERNDKRRNDDRSKMHY